MPSNLDFTLNIDAKLVGAENLNILNRGIQSISSNASISEQTVRNLEAQLTAALRKGVDLITSLANISSSAYNTDASLHTLARGLVSYTDDAQRGFTTTREAIRKLQEEAVRAEQKIQSVQSTARRFTVALPGGRIGSSSSSSGSSRTLTDRLEHVAGLAGAHVVGADLLGALNVPGGSFIAGNLFRSLGLSGPAALAVGGAAAGVAGATFLIEQAEKTAKYAQAQDVLAKETGMTAQQVQLFGRVAEVTGTQASALFATVNKLNDGMAQGGAKSREIQRALQALGLDASVAFEAPEAQMSKVLGALKNVGEESRRVALVVGLFGDEGRKLLPLVDNFRAVANAVTATGVVIDSDGIEKLKRYREETERLGLAWAALRNKIAIPVLGTLSYIMDTITPGGGGYLSLSGGAKAAGLATSGAQLPGIENIIHRSGDPGALLPGVQHKKELNKRIQDAKLSGLDEVGRIENEIKITNEEIQNADKTPTEDTPGRIKELNQRLTQLKAQMTAAEKHRAFRRQAEEKSIEAHRKAVELEAAKIFGTSPEGKYQTERYKIQLDENDYLRQSKAAGVPDAVGRRRAAEQFDPLRGAAGQQYLNAVLKGRDRINPDTGLFESPQAIEAQGDRLKESTRREQQAEGQRLVRLGSRESARGAFYTPPIGNILDDKNRAISRGSPMVMEGERVAPPPGSVSIKEAQRDVVDFRRRGLESIHIQKTLGQLGGFQVAEADYTLRIRVADRELEVAQRKIRLLENENQWIEANELREDAEDKKREEYAQARLDREREIASVTANQMREFSSGFASIIMGAQHGKAGPAIKGFFEGQESKILHNIGDKVFSGGAGGVFHSIGKNLPPWLTKGTLLENPGEKPEDKIKTGADNFGKHVEKFGFIVRELQSSPSASIKYGDAVSREDAGMGMESLLNLPSSYKKGLVGGIGEAFRNIPLNSSADIDAIYKMLYSTANEGSTNLVGGTTLPPGFPGVFGAGSTMVGLSPLLNFSTVFPGSGSGGPFLDPSGQSPEDWGIMSAGGPGAGPSASANFFSGLRNTSNAAIRGITSAYGGKGAVGAYDTIFRGQNPNAYTDDSGQSPSDWGFGDGPSGSSSTSDKVGTAVGVAGIVGGAVHGIKKAAKGGAGNIIGGSGETLMAVAPLTGPAAPFVEAAGMVMELVSSLLGDPKKKRADEISKQIFTQQYMAPEAMNISEAAGGYSDVDRYGNIRTSRFSPYSTTQGAYLDVPRRTVIPGHTTSEFGGPTGDPSALNLPNPYGGARPPATTLSPSTYNVTIHAMDPASFSDVMNRNAYSVLDAVHTGIQNDHHPVIGALRDKLGTNR